MTESKQTAGTKDRSWKGIHFGTLSAIMQEQGSGGKNPIKLSWPEESPVPIDRRQRNERGMVNTSN